MSFGSGSRLGLGSLRSSSPTHRGTRGNTHPPSQDPPIAIPKDFASNPTGKTEDILKASLSLLGSSPNEETVTNITNAFKEVEGIYQRMRDSKQKDDLAAALRESHKKLADAIIALTSGTSRQPTMPQILKNATFAQSTLGRFTAATYLQQDAKNRLPAKHYSYDMMPAQIIEKYSVSAALYTEGLFEATKPGTSPPTLTMTDKFDILARFTPDQEVSAPLDRDETYAPFVAAQRNALLQNGDTSALAQYPLLAKAVKIGLPEHIKTKIDTTWIRHLQTATSSGEKQWETQFAGFETELLEGLCQHLDKEPKNLDLPVLALAMAVAEKCDTADAYKKVISRIQDSDISLLIGRDADQKSKTIVAKNPQWKSAIGERISKMHTSAQEKLLTAAMLIEVKLPPEATAWVPKLGRTHIGGRDSMIPLKALFGGGKFMITPKALFEVLKDNPLAATPTNTKECDFCKAVDTFCKDPSAEDAPEINALYRQATQFGTEETQPLELRTRIALIKGILENLATLSEQNMTVADLGNRTWPETINPPLKRPQTFGPASKNSSYHTAMQAFQAEKGSSTTPKTLNDWVKFLKYDGDAKVDKYTDHASKAEATSQDSAKRMYTDLASDTKAFSDTMNDVTKALSKNDIPTVRAALQSAIGNMSTTYESCAGTPQFTKSSMDAKTKRLEVLEEMITACRRLNKRIAGMLEADKPTKVAETPPTVIPTATATPSPKTPRTALKELKSITDREIFVALRPALRAYDAGLRATTKADIDKQITALSTEGTGSIDRVAVETKKTQELDAEVDALTRKNEELRELLTTIEQITAGQPGNDAARLALGAAHDATTGTGGSGLLLGLANAKAALAAETQEWQARTQELAQLEQGIVELTENRSELQRANQTRTARITAIHGANGNDGEKAALTADLNTLTTTTIPDLERREREDTAALARLDVDLANREAVTALDADIAALRLQITALEEALVIQAGGNATTLDAIRLLDEGQLRTTIDAQRIALTTLRDTTLPNAITRRDIDIPTAIAGLDAEIVRLNLEIGVATARLVILNGDDTVAGSIATAIAAREAKQGDVTAAKELKSLLEGTTIPDLQADIGRHKKALAAFEQLTQKKLALATEHKRPNGEAALPDDQVQDTIDANVPLLAAEKIKLDIQTELLEKVTIKENKIHTAIAARRHNLDIRKTNLGIEAKAQRQALERDTFLGTTDLKGTRTLGDDLAEMIAKLNSKDANLDKYQQLQTQLQTNQLGKALATIAAIKDAKLTFLSDAIPSYREKHSAILKEVAPQAPSFISKLTPWSTQRKAWIATGTVTTMADRIRLAVNYGDFRKAKASTPAATAAVKSYTDAINGDNTSDPKLSPLETLLMNDTPAGRQAAIQQLDVAIRDIRDAITRNNIATEDKKDPKLPQVGNKLIAALNDLKSNIDQATRKTAAGRSDKMGEVASLRQALILLSDDHLSAGSVQRTTVLKQSDFHKPTTKSTEATQTTTVSLSAKAMLPTARAKLEKMGLLHNPATPWSAEVSTELCTLFLAEVQSNGKLFATITDTANDCYNTFRNLMADTKTPNLNSSLQSLAKKAKEDNSAMMELNAIFRKLKSTYTELYTKDSGLKQFPALKTQAERLATYLKSLEEDSAKSAKITDPNEQKLLCTLGILVPTTSIPIDDAAAESIGRLYEHRPLTMGLLTDVYAAAPHAASEPNVIRCMRTAFSQATGLSGTKESDKDLMHTLYENSAAWSLALLQQPWDQDQSPKAAVTNADRLTNTISAYKQACVLRDRLSAKVVEKDSKTQDATNLQNISDTLDHLLLDIQRGVDQCNTQGKEEVKKLSLHDTPEKQLAAVKKIIPVNPAQSASPSVSQQRVTFSQGTLTLPLELTKKTRLSEFPPEFALTVGEQKQHVTRFYPDGEPNSKTAALATLFGRASSIPVDGNLLRSVHDDSDIATQLTSIDASKEITGAMEKRFVACLNALPEERQKTILAVANLPKQLEDTCTVDNINRYLDFVKKADTAVIYPQDLLFLSELYARPIRLFTHHSLGTEKLTMERTCADSKEKPIHIAVSEGNYERWEIRHETGVAAPQMYSAYSSTYAASTQAKRLPRSVLPPNTVVTRTDNDFGTAFSGNTDITCWLEAFIYSTAYEKEGTTLELLKENSAKLKNPTEDSPLATWKIANSARADALMMLSEFLDSVQSKPTDTRDITELDRTLQRVFFGEAWRQQDAMQFREMLMGTLCEIMKAEEGNALETPFSMTRASKKVIDGVSVPTTENRFMAHEAVEFRINLHQEGAALATNPDLSEYLVSQDAEGTVANYTLGDGSKATITKGARVFVGTAPPTCQIQVMSAVNDYTHASPAAHTLTPTNATTDTPFITLPIKASDDDAADDVQYLIKQVVVRRGAGTEGGHYECYFKHNDQWYLKTSNGNPAKKVGGGFPAIHQTLTDGGHTYTYMGVKA